MLLCSKSTKSFLKRTKKFSIAAANEMLESFAKDRKNNGLILIFAENSWAWEILQFIYKIVLQSQRK